MFWENPRWLLGWWALPAVVALMFWARRRQVDAGLRFAEENLLGRLLPVTNTTRRFIKAAALVVALGLLVAGAARPKWGAYFETVHSRGVDLFVLLDVSRSMMAEDLAPNRLARAKADIRDLFPHLTGDRVGLIAFAGVAVVKVPLTTDQGYFLSVLDEVDPTSAPRGGTSIGDAIRKGLESMEPHADRDQVLVLITDGEDHDSFPLEAARQAAERGVKIFTVGLGDIDEGRRIPVRDEQGKLTYLQHDGQEVWSKMNEKTLSEIALATGGAYIAARTRTYDLGEVYQDHLATLTRGEIAAETRKRYGDRFQWFLLGGFALLFFDLMLPRYPRGKR
jgi:Ca-activated chloride channel family protein